MNEAIVHWHNQNLRFSHRCNSPHAAAFSRDPCEVTCAQCLEAIAEEVEEALRCDHLWHTDALVHSDFWRCPKCTKNWTEGG